VCEPPQRSPLQERSRAAYPALGLPLAGEHDAACAARATTADRAYDGATMPSRVRRTERDVARFDAWSERYDDSYLQRVLFDRVQARVVEAARESAPEARSVLDVGCGTGRLLLRLGEVYPAARLTGVDPAPGMARIAGQRHRIMAMVGSAERLPLQAGSFDLVVTTMSFHHWVDQRLGLAEVRRVLVPGGHLLLADAVATAWLRPVFALARARSRFHTGVELDAMLAGAGLGRAGRLPVPGLSGAVTVTVAALDPT
jgi:SAM-dependent methyltransferase